MLRWFIAARFAPSGSPEKEQRLLGFANANSPQDPNASQKSDAQKKSGAKERDILSKRQKFHDAIFNATDEKSQDSVIREYMPEILEVTGGTEADVQNNDSNEIVEMTRMALVDRLIGEEDERKTLAKIVGTVDTSSMTDDEMSQLIKAHRELFERYISIGETSDAATVINLVQAILHKEIVQIEKLKFAREKSAKWNFLIEEDFEELYWKGKKPEGATSPSAFVLGNTVHFNVDHADFRGEDRELLAKRAVIHEMTHVALGVAEKNNVELQKWTDTLRSHPRWNELHSALKDMFQSNATMQGEAPTLRKMVDEALAIYTAEERAPKNLKPDSPRMRIALILRDIFESPHTGQLTTLKTALDSKLDHLLESKDRNGNRSQSIDAMLLQAAQDSQLNQQSEAIIENDPENAERRANANEDIAEVEKKEKDDVSTQDLVDKTQSVKGKLTSMTTQSDALASLVDSSPIEGDDKQKMHAEVQTLRESLGNMATDLVAIESLGDALHRWDKLSPEEKMRTAERLQFPNNPYKKVEENTLSMAEADALSAAHRKNAIKTLHKLLTGWEKMIKNIEDAVEKGNGEKQASESSVVEGSFTGWIKKTFLSSGGGIVWLSPLNIVNIVKSYRDAIVENYKSGQLVKENMTARAISEKFFFFKPIRHTLKKLSRSTNSKETSEFKEYITAEGFTFTEIFGTDGKGEKEGLLFDNRHNFNRAKAVLEYAADHAWLYFLNRLDGHDVYGIDFEGVEGKQSFEELIDMHEAGKTKQIQGGTDKVDKDPDVEPIMEIMVHELEQKNIFAVQGIMKRLQDKAKFSHSNTWMLTTLLMYIRDNCNKDPTLKHCLDKGMIDNISNHTIGQSAWSITWLKMKRNAIDEWKNNGEKDGRIGFAKNNIITATMERIEQRLEEGGAKFPDTEQGRLDKYEAIGMVLSGKTYPINVAADGSDASRVRLLSYGWIKGKTISIFENEFSEYRKKFREFTESASCDPSSTDPDYFNYQNGGSDVLLLHNSQFTKILQKSSTSRWDFEEKARGLFTQIFDRYDELGRVDPEAQESFRKEMQAKIEYWWDAGMDKSRKPTFMVDRDFRNELIWKELINRGLVGSTVEKQFNSLASQRTDNSAG